VSISYYSYSYCSPSAFDCAQESFLVICSSFNMVNSNSSKNFAAQLSSGMAIFPSASSATISYMNVDSCIKNELNAALLVMYYGVVFNHCNIINNTGLGLIGINTEYNGGKIDLVSCIILSNTFTIMFRGFSTIIPKLVGCYYQNPYQTDIQLSSCFSKSTASHSLDLLSTGYCLTNSLPFTIPPLKSRLFYSVFSIILFL